MNTLSTSTYWIVVAVVVFQLLPLGQHDAATSADDEPRDAARADSLTLVTYNVLANDFAAERRVPALLKLLEDSNADVIALQEVTPWFLAMLHKQEWPETWFQSALIAESAPGGLLILSRHPIRRSIIQPIPTRQRRVLLMVEIHVGGDRVRIVTAHLESPLESNEARTAQLKIASKLLDDADHAVLLGDLNFSEGWQPETRTVARYSDAWRDVHPKRPGYTWNIEASEMAERGSFPGEKSGRIDRVLYRSEVWRAVEAEIIGSTPLVEGSRRYFPSDHFGLRVTLRRQRDNAANDE